MKVIAVIPAYNEEKTVARVVRQTKKYVDKVIVVDDCSSDSTGELAKKAGAKVVRHKRNRGVGCSWRTGFKEVLKEKADVVITIDADGQHKPSDIPKFLKALEGVDFVIGTRDFSVYPFTKRFGNWGLRSITNLLSGTKVKDTESGYRAIRSGLLGKMKLTGERYEICAEIIYEAGRNKGKIAEVPIKVPVYVKGVGVLDGLKTGLFIFRKWLRKSA